MNLIMDIDGTLWNTTEIVARAWNDALIQARLDGRFGAPVTADILKKEFGKPTDEIVDDLFPGLNPDERKRIIWATHVIEQERLRDTEEILSYPGVYETLNTLSKSVKLFIVSNCQEGYIPLTMNKLEITGLIGDYECFGHTGLSKGENIALLMKRNKLDPSHTYYLGDTLGDYRSTIYAGASFIFASYGFGEMESDYNGLAIGSFTELIDLCNKIASEKSGK